MLLRNYLNREIRVIKYLASLLLYTVSAPTMSAAVLNTGIGGVAANMMEPVGLAANFIYVGCLMLGSSFLFASIIKYIEHRRSPLMVPISTVIFLIIAGVLLMVLPFAYLLMNNQSPYTLLG